MIKIIIDTMGCDPGSAFVYCAPNSPVKDPRIDGRFGRTYGPDGEVRGVYLETYASGELGLDCAAFGSTYVEASYRRGAVVKLLRELGYPRGVEYVIVFERD